MAEFGVCWSLLVFGFVGWTLLVFFGVDWSLRVSDDVCWYWMDFIAI